MTDWSTFPTTGVDFPFSFYVEPTWKRPAHIEVRDGFGHLIRYITRIESGTISQRINEPSKLEFSAAISDPASGDLQSNNQVWLRDKDENVVDKFTIRARTEQGSGNTRTVRIEAYGWLEKLGREIVSTYDTTDTVANIVAALIAMQAGNNQISVGTIDATIGATEISIELEQQSILQGLRKIEETLSEASMFFVSADRELYWYSLPRLNTGQRLRLDHNATEITRSESTKELANRIYYFGARESVDDPIKISDDDGYSVDYVQSTLAAWKYRKQFVIDPDQVTIDTDEGTAGVADFAVHVDITDARLIGEDGDSFRWCNSSGETAYDWELISINSTTGALDCWVVLPTVSAVVATPFYLFFGESAAESTSESLGAAREKAGQTTAWQATWDTNAADPSDFYAEGVPHSLPGIVSRRFNDNAVHYPATLIAMATRKLAELSGAVITYSASLIDLSEAGSGLAAIFYNLTLGAGIHIVDEVLGIDTTETLIGISKNLLAPIDTSIELQNRELRITDIIAELVERADEVANTDPIERLPADAIDLPNGETLADILYTDTDDIDCDDVRIGDEVTLGDITDGDTGRVYLDDVQSDDGESIGTWEQGETGQIDSAKINHQGAEGDIVTLDEWEYAPAGVASGMIDYDMIGNPPDLSATCPTVLVSSWAVGNGV